MDPQQLIDEAQKAGLSAHYSDGNLYICVDTSTLLADLGYKGPSLPLPATACLPPIPVDYLAKKAEAEIAKDAKSAGERLYSWIRGRLYGSKASQ